MGVKIAISLKLASSSSSSSWWSFPSHLDHGGDWMLSSLQSLYLVQPTVAGGQVPALCLDHRHRHRHRQRHHPTITSESLALKPLFQSPAARHREALQDQVLLLLAAGSVQIGLVQIALSLSLKNVWLAIPSQMLHFDCHRIPLSSETLKMRSFTEAITMSWARMDDR